MITRDDWLTAIEEAGVGNPVDDQLAVTAIEFEKLTGWTRSRTKRALAVMVEKGLAIRTTKRYQRPDRKFYYITAYRLKDTPKKKKR